jgi:hypothetical protein
MAASMKEKSSGLRIASPTQSSNQARSSIFRVWAMNLFRWIHRWTFTFCASESRS